MLQTDLALQRTINAHLAGVPNATDAQIIVVPGTLTVPNVQSALVAVQSSIGSGFRFKAYKDAVLFISVRFDDPLSIVGSELRLPTTFTSETMTTTTLSGTLTARIESANGDHYITGTLGTSATDFILSGNVVAANGITIGSVAFTLPAAVNDTSGEDMQTQVEAEFSRGPTFQGPVAGSLESGASGWGGGYLAKEGASPSFGSYPPNHSTLPSSGYITPIWDNLVIACQGDTYWRAQPWFHIFERPTASYNSIQPPNFAHLNVAVAIRDIRAAMCVNGAWEPLPGLSYAFPINAYDLTVRVRMSDLATISGAWETDVVGGNRRVRALYNPSVSGSWNTFACHHAIGGAFRVGPMPSPPALNALVIRADFRIEPIDSNNPTHVADVENARYVAGVGIDRYGQNINQGIIDVTCLPGDDKYTSATFGRLRPLTRDWQRCIAVAFPPSGGNGYMATLPDLPAGMV